MQWRGQLRDSSGKHYNTFLESIFDMSGDVANFANLYRQFKQHYAFNRFFVQKFEPTEKQLESMIKGKRLILKGDTPVKVILDVEHNKDMLVKKNPMNKNTGVFPDMISMDYGDNFILLEAQEQTGDFVTFQDYKPIPILGVKNYATEFDLNSPYKTSVFEFNNPDVDTQSVITSTYEVTAEPTKAERIYYSLPDKTETGNVRVVDNIFKNKANKDIITAFRVDKKLGLLESLKRYNAVGNPIPWKNYKPRFKGDNAGIAFVDWYLGNDFTNLEQEYRKELISKKEDLKDKTIEYYKELGRPSHATVLDYLINEEVDVVETSTQPTTQLGVPSGEVIEGSQNIDSKRREELIDKYKHCK